MRTRRHPAQIACDAAQARAIAERIRAWDPLSIAPDPWDPHRVRRVSLVGSAYVLDRARWR